MRQMPSKKPEVVRALILSSAIRLMVSRVVLMNLRQRFITESRRRYSAEMSDFIEREMVRRTPTKRFVKVWGELSLLFLPEVLRVAGIEWNHDTLELLLISEIIDPNVGRDSLFERLANA